MLEICVTGGTDAHAYCFGREYQVIKFNVVLCKKITLGTKPEIATICSISARLRLERCW